MTLSFSETLASLLEKTDLDSSIMKSAVRAMLENEWTPVQISGFLVALRAKGETKGEIVAAVEVMREHALPVKGVDPDTVVDVVGTGGDGKGTFNISTLAAFIAAAAGVRIAKHSNRALSGTSGSFDLLEALGASIPLMTPDRIAEAIETIGIGFMFAPNHHSSLKYAAPVRKELGVRTIFNVLGPLSNPAGALRQMTGVFLEELVDVYVETLKALGSKRCLIVHGDGIDEITIAGETRAAELREDGSIVRYVIKPEDFGMKRAPLESIQISSAEESLAVVEKVLDGEEGPRKDVVLMNAGATIYVGGLSDSLQEGVECARSVLDSGESGKKIKEFVEMFPA